MNKKVTFKLVMVFLKIISLFIVQRNFGKVGYPYEYMDDWEKLNETLLLEKK